MTRNKPSNPNNATESYRGSKSKCRETCCEKKRKYLTQRMHDVIWLYISQIMLIQVLVHELLLWNETAFKALFFSKCDLWISLSGDFLSLSYQAQNSAVSRDTLNGWLCSHQNYTCLNIVQSEPEIPGSIAKAAFIFVCPTLHGT